MSTQKIPIPAGATEVIVDTVEIVTSAVIVESSVPDASVSFFTPPPNQPPVVDAGASQSITAPQSSVFLNGSGSDADGIITRWQWKQLSGPSTASIVSPTSPVTQVAALSVGVYTFDLSATDDDNTTTISATTTVTVLSAPNQPPVVNGGSDKSITLPTNSVILVALASDGDGTISTTAWTKVAGPNTYTFSNANSLTNNVSALVEGTYIFRITVSDNRGAFSYDDVQVVVNPAPVPPPTGYVLSFSSGYDTLADITWQGNGQYGREPVSSHLSTTFYKTGPGSFYSVPANVSNGTRSEVQYTNSEANPTEGAVEYDVYYEVIVPNNGCSVQWHPNTGGSSGSPYLMHQGGKFTLAMWLRGGGVNYYPTGVTIPSKKWIHIRHEYKYGAGGYWKIIIDGITVLNKTNIQVGDGSGQYLKVGYNGWDASSPNSRIYFDNLQVWRKI